MWVLYVVIAFLMVAVAIVLVYKFIDDLKYRNRKDHTRRDSYGGYNFNYDKNAEAIGEEGELQVALKLRSFKENMYVFNDYKTMNGNRTCQIDHIVVSNYGVFVLETKNYKGIITGLRNQREWTQTLLYGEEKHKFYNPIMQNNTHKEVVKRIIGSIVPIFAYVIFVNNDLEYITEPDVIRLDELHQAMFNREQTISYEQAQSIIAKLKEHRADFTKEEHVNNIRKAAWMVENNICPRCGGKLVLRHGKFGDFYGCENYPQCEFKKEIDINEKH